jgi:hypothetical protein
MARTALLAPLWAGIAALGQASQLQPVNHPVISELRYRQHSGVNEEFVELYNPMPRTVDLSGWSLAYKKKTGGNWDVKVVFRRGHALKPGGYFLWGGTAVTTAPDTAETGASGVGLGNSGGNIALRDNTGNDVDRVAWEGGDSAEGRPAAGKNVEGGSLERKAHAGSTGESMSPGGADASAGNGYDTDDNESDFILHNHFAETGPQNTGSPSEPEGDWFVGKGTCAAFPSAVPVCATVSLRLTFRPDSSGILTEVGAIVPRRFGWSFDPSDVRTEGPAANGGTAHMNGDTVRVSGLSLGYPDSVSMVLLSLSAPAQPDTVEFQAFTAGAWFLPIRRCPVVVVEIAVLPILRLHANDGMGVPAAPFGIGARFRTTGIVTAGYGFPFPDRAFLQDATAGVTLFGDRPPFELQTGDSITVEGAVAQSFGTTGLVPDWDRLILHGRNCAVPEPADRSCAELNACFRDDGTEPDESRLVRVPCVAYDSETEIVSDGTGAVRLFTGGASSLTVPSGAFSVVGLLRQRTAGEDGPPVASDFELVPRCQSDLVPLEDPQAVSASAFAEIRSSEGSLGLLPNSPNPFNGETRILFNLPSEGRVRLSVFDARGRKIAVLLRGSCAPGLHVVRWGGEDGAGQPLPSGAYVARLEACGEVRMRKILMVR